MKRDRIKDGCVRRRDIATPDRLSGNNSGKWQQPLYQMILVRGSDNSPTDFNSGRTARPTFVRFWCMDSNYHLAKYLLSQFRNTEVIL